LSDSSLPVRLPQRRPLAAVEPLYRDRDDRYESFDDDLDDEFYESDSGVTWVRETERRRALG
jgi:hypothetical protein